ncbi:hypothetical protein O181_046027 [Austropuccinia psidii MF-1]|uniref:Chromo domain-containing protein n=1 Tax=Austropuccinia psidii MF-1 TaxID=1389203 RepID=A0A9Q3DV07_9BASI|nr:hypothetical protein [Austropuccinia psidii MF-1]
MDDSFDYAKQKWERSHKVEDLKVGDLVLASNFDLNNIKGPKKLKYSIVGPFVTFSSHGTNAVQVELSGEMVTKHPTFPVSLKKCYQPAEKDFFPSKNPTPLTVPQVEYNEEKKIYKGDLEGKKQREYLLRYRNTIHEDEWLAELDIPDSGKPLRRFGN